MSSCAMNLDCTRVHGWAILNDCIFHYYLVAPRVPQYLDEKCRIVLSCTQNTAEKLPCRSRKHIINLFTHYVGIYDNKLRYLTYVAARGDQWFKPPANGSTETLTDAFELMVGTIHGSQDFEANSLVLRDIREKKLKDLPRTQIACIYSWNYWAIN